MDAVTYRDFDESAFPGVTTSKRNVRDLLGLTPESSVAVTKEAQVREDAGVITDKLMRDVRNEDLRMRSEVLPTPPEGYRWQGEMQTSSIDYSSLVGEFRVRLVYRMEKI
jgi:hypothetical protein